MIEVAILVPVDGQYGRSLTPLQGPALQAGGRPEPYDLYLNTVGGFRAEDLIAHHVLHYVDAHYRALADRRARPIAGICEGSFGAMNLDLKWSRHLWIDLWSYSRLLESYIRLSEMNISHVIVPIVWPVRDILGIMYYSRILRMLSCQ
jgi:hypothetical protein